MAQLYSNNGQSTLSASSTSTDTTLFIQPGHGARFPVISGADFFYVTLENAAGNLEVCKVTSHSSSATSMVVQRGQQGTTARSWASGDLIELRATAAEMTAFETDIDNLELTRALRAGDTHTGTHLFTGTANFTGTVTAPTLSYGSTGNQIATVDYVAAASFATSLPGQAGNSGKILQTDGTNAIWIDYNKEDTIVPGTTSQYLTGDKSWSDFSSSVRVSILSGFSTAVKTVVQASDTVLVAIGKLQGQISDVLSTLTNHTSSIGNLQGKISGVLSTLTNHTSSKGNVHDLTVQDIGLTSMSQTVAANTIAQRDSNGDIFARILNSTDTLSESGVTGVMVKAGDNYLRTGTRDGVKSFLAYTGNEISANRNNSATDIGTAQEIRWKNYGNNHTIFDASAGTAPNGTAINNAYPQNSWISTYPTIMGWDGGQTYGVRVDSARFSENTNASAINRITTNTSISSMGSISISGQTGGYAGIWFSDTSSGILINTINGNFGYLRNGNFLWTGNTSGDFYATGNVTAYSDERLKADWKDLDKDFIEKWSSVKHGVYRRIDNDQTQVGLSAQSVREILPESVIENKDGILSLNYGAAAAVATVQLAKKIMELTARIEAMEANK